MTIDGWTIEPHEGGWRAVLDESRSRRYLTTAELIGGALHIEDEMQYYPDGSYSISLAVIDELRARAQ